jgi:hypothetical protein
MTQAILSEDEEVSRPPPCGFLIGIYLFYENWSTEPFRKKKLESELFVTPQVNTENHGG